MLDATKTTESKKEVEAYLHQSSWCEGVSVCPYLGRKQGGWNFCTGSAFQRPTRLKEKEMWKSGPPKLQHHSNQPFICSHLPYRDSVLLMLRWTLRTLHYCPGSVALQASKRTRWYTSTFVPSIPAPYSAPVLLSAVCLKKWSRCDLSSLRRCPSSGRGAENETPECGIAHRKCLSICEVQLRSLWE